MPVAKLRDIELYYEIQGAGPRLLVIGGTGWDLRRSPTIFEMPIADGFEILTYDQRGLGRSAKPDIRYSADYANDAVNLLDVIGWDRCHVMGISFGGMVAQEFALSFPERIQSLVLACCSCGGNKGAAYPLHELIAVPPSEYAWRMTTLSDKRRNAEWQRTNAAEFQAMLDRATARRVQDQSDPVGQVGARRQLEARATHDTHGRLSSLPMPVYICGGKYDGIVSPEKLALLHALIPGSHLELFEGGHQFYLQDAMAFQGIRSFLHTTRSAQDFPEVV